MSSSAEHPKDLTPRVAALEAELAELRHREARWRHALEGAQDGVWDWHVPSGQVVYSDVLVRMLGYEPEEFAPDLDSWKARVHPDDLAHVMAVLSAHLEGRTPWYASEHRVRCKDGSWKWILDRGRVVERAADGTALRMVGTHSDISERRQAEEALRQSEARFHAFMSHAPMVAWSTRRDGRLVYCNEAWARLHQRPPEALIGRTIDELFPPETARTYLDNNRQVLETGKALRVVEPGPREDGSPGQYLAFRFPLPSDGDGNAQVGGLSVDITESVHHEEELRAAEQAAQAAAAAKDAFLATMSHELRTPMNAVLGYTELLLAGDLDPTQRERARTVYRSAEALLTIINDILDFAKIEAGRLELEDLRFDLHTVVHDVIDLFRPRVAGTPVELLVRLDPRLPLRFVGDPGRLRQVLVNLVGNAVKFTRKGWILVEATAAAQHEDRSALRITVSDTGPGVPAELRPLLFQPFAQGDSSISRRYGGTGLGLVISRRLLELMDGTLTLADTPGPGAVFVIDLSLPTSSASGPAASVSLRGRRVLVVDDDPLNRQILLEQLGAAEVEAEAVSDGGAALARLAAGARFDAVLLDNRLPGIDGMALARALRADARTARLVLVLLSSGTATIDAALIKTAGLNAHLEKPVRQDALVRVLAECLAAAPGELRTMAVTEASAAPRSGDAPLPPLRVLVAEDNSVSRALVQSMLERLGATVTLVATGREALAAVRAGRFDLVLMDCQMPEMDGYEATAAIRAEEERAGARRLPIVALTANALKSERERCQTAGMDDHIAKPVTTATLRATLVRWGQPGPAEALLDLARLDEALESIGPQLQDEFLRQLRASVLDHTAHLHAAEAAGDAVALRRAAHTLKGACLDAGASALARRADRIEELARGGAVAGVAELLRELDALGPRTLAAFEHAVAARAGLNV